MQFRQPDEKQAVLITIISTTIGFHNECGTRDEKTDQESIISINRLIDLLIDCNDFNVGQTEHNESPITIITSNKQTHLYE